MSTEANVVLSTVKWSDSSQHLQEFTKKYELPQIGKIVKGQYACVGAPSLSSPSLQPIVLWDSGPKRVNIMAQSVRFKECRTSIGINGRSVPVGPKLVIPENYEGWWEILSEEGKSVKCIESVTELAKKYPESCLVRETLKARTARNDETNQVSDKVRAVQTGELLTLLNADVISSNSKSGAMGMGMAVRYLKCRSSKGDILYLSYEQKGKFSPVAKEGISGVHTISNLLSKRLPLMVRLVYGKPPQGSKHFNSDLRLYSTFEEECFLAIPLLKDTQNVIQVPISSGLKILGPKNVNELCESREFCALKESSKQLMENLREKSHLLDSHHFNSDIKALLKDNQSIKEKLNGHQYDHKQRLQSNFLVKRSSSDPQQLNQSIETNDVLKRGTSLDDSQRMQSSRTEQIINNENDVNNEFYDEIDQIYDYVRGFAPLPQRIKSDFEANKTVDPLKTSILNNDNKPEPPPIINIPSIQNHRMSYPMASNKLSVNMKKMKKFFPNKDNIFTKNNKTEDKTTFSPNLRYSYHNNSNDQRIYLPTATAQPNYAANNGPKLFVKHSSGQRNTWKCNRFLKYAKHVSSPFRNDSFNENGVKQQKNSSTKGVANQTFRSSRSLTTSPIFNIRYKSMNNLHYITPPTHDYNNTLESSHSGRTSSGSGSKELFRDPKSKLPKLSRSLNNIFWDMSGNFIAIDTINKLNNELNEKKNMTSPQLLPVHIDFLNALDKLQQQNQQIKEQNLKSKQMTTLYL